MEFVIKKVDWVSPHALFEIFRSDYASLLHSGKNGQYSILGLDPFLRIRSKNSDTEVFQNDTVTHYSGDPLILLREKISEMAPKFRRDFFADLPFIGGAMGYFSYDFGVTFENIKQRVKDDLLTPDLFFVFPSKIFVFDHEKRQIYLLLYGQNRTALSQGLQAIEERLQSKTDDRYDDDLSIDRTLLRNFPVHYNVDRRRRTHSKPLAQVASDVLTRLQSKHIESNLTFPQYLKKIGKIQEYLRKGETYQVNFSQRFCVDVDSDPFLIYKRISTLNPSPFQAYFEFPDIRIVSASPERLCRLYLSGKQWIVETSPIKGTVLRGKTSQIDEENRLKLLHSLKDRAELDMIVDLARNDIGRVCVHGSVRVTDHRRTEEYSHVWHTVSDVSGILAPQHAFVDVIRSAFPGGSITGCPKKRTMEIIDELEDYKRGIYTGSCGYIGYDGAMDFNIMIRTIAFKDGKAYFQAGGGIVADSEAEKEYQETLHKAAAMRESILLASP